MLKSFKIPKTSKCVNTSSNEESFVTKSSIIDNPIKLTESPQQQPQIPPPQQQHNNYHFKKKKFLLEYQENNESSSQ
jgi:hypothetical protein